MTKFNVIQDTIQTNQISDRKAVEELIISSDSNNSIIAQFDTLEEAKAFALSKANEIITARKQGYCSSFTEIEYLMIEEVEYDEDGDFVDSEIWDVIFDIPECEDEENE